MVCIFLSRPGGSLELVGFRHCKLGNGAADAVAELIKRSKTIVDTWTQHTRFPSSDLFFYLFYFFLMV